jgi:hypothetical protein
MTGTYPLMRFSVSEPPHSVAVFRGLREWVQQRLDEISHEAQNAGQFGPAVRAEELLGKSIGLFIDRSLELTGQLNDSHVAALLELARKRQQEPIDLADDAVAHDRSAQSDDDDDHR